MTNDNVTLSREQAGEIFKALDGIGNLVKNLVSTPGNPADACAIMSGFSRNMPAATYSPIQRISVGRTLLGPPTVTFRRA